MTNEELRAAATEMMIAIAASTRDDPIRRKEECLYEVCRQWLAEYPEDDEEPVTEEWLRDSVGWIPVERSGYIGQDGIIFCKGSDSVYSAWLKISDHYYDMRRIVRVKTRGDVRRLCTALVIELKEGSK